MDAKESLVSSKRLSLALIERRLRAAHGLRGTQSPDEEGDQSEEEQPIFRWLGRGGGAGAKLLPVADLRAQKRKSSDQQQCERQASNSKQYQNTIACKQNNNDNEKSPTRSLTHGSSGAAAAAAAADDDDDDDDDASKRGASNNNDAHHINNELAAEVKKRLSLPADTKIPDSFLIKHESSHLCELNKQTLTRVARRQSLFEIGFGRESTYLKHHVLGAGTYSTVYKGTSHLTRKLVALKEIQLERDEGVPFTAIREVSLLKQLKHCNIITLHDIIYTTNTLTLVFEFVDRDLSRYMSECEAHKINPNNVRLFLFQMLRGLNFCHQRRILHRDLKPQNILIGAGGHLKLADFGLARAKSVPTKTLTDEVVTLWYRPPDVLLGNVEYGTSIDMWGVGCIFFEMAEGRTLFTGSNSHKQLEGIFELLGTPDEQSWPHIRLDLQRSQLDQPRFPGTNPGLLAPSLDQHGVQLLMELLKCNPNSRISASDAMHHCYFRSLPPEVHQLAPSQSIFSLDSVKLSKETIQMQPGNIIA